MGSRQSALGALPKVQKVPGESEQASRGSAEVTSQVRDGATPAAVQRHVSRPRRG